MDIAALNRVVAEDAALRRRQTLQPAGGKGDRVFSRIRHPTKRKNVRRALEPAQE